MKCTHIVKVIVPPGQTGATPGQEFLGHLNGVGRLKEVLLPDTGDWIGIDRTIERAMNSRFCVNSAAASIDWQLQAFNDAA